MKKIIFITFLVFLLAACAASPQAGQPTLLSATTIPNVDMGSPQPTTKASDDLFGKMGIKLPVPACNGTFTAAQTEGPYYTANTPERNSLLEEGMQGKKLVVIGYVLAKNCQPLANVWIDFWQADSNGSYDNAGYTLRGHQYTDAQGRYLLETVYPGEYPGRTQHIHVKIQPSGGAMLTTQLYFPDSASNLSDGIFDPTLIVTLENRGDITLAYFNFVLNN